MPKESFIDQVAYYLKQHPNTYSANKDKILIFMNKRWKTVFKRTKKALKLPITDQSFPDITLVCESGLINKSDQAKFITDFRDVLMGMACGKHLSDDGDWIDTRCLIGIIEDNFCKAIFCRGDGDLVHKGQILLENYDEENLKKLINLGDIWTLGRHVGEKHNPSAPTPGYTIFHERDRGIKRGAKAIRFYENYSDLLRNADWSIQPIFFIMKDGVWFVGAPKKDYGNLIKKGAVLTLDEALKRARK